MGLRNWNWRVTTTSLSSRQPFIRIDLSPWHSSLWFPLCDSFGTLKRKSIRVTNSFFLRSISSCYDAQMALQILQRTTLERDYWNTTPLKISAFAVAVERSFALQPKISVKITWQNYNSPNRPGYWCIFLVNPHAHHLVLTPLFPPSKRAIDIVSLAAPLGYGTIPYCVKNIPFSSIEDDRMKQLGTNKVAVHPAVYYSSTLFPLLSTTLPYSTVSHYPQHRIQLTWTSAWVRRRAVGRGIAQFRKRRPTVTGHFRPLFVSFAFLNQDDPVAGQSRDQDDGCGWEL